MLERKQEDDMRRKNESRKKSCWLPLGDEKKTAAENAQMFK